MSRDPVWLTRLVGEKVTTTVQELPAARITFEELQGFAPPVTSTENLSDVPEISIPDIVRFPVPLLLMVTSKSLVLTNLNRTETKGGWLYSNILNKSTLKTKCKILMAQLRAAKHFPRYQWKRLSR